MKKTTLFFSLAVFSIRLLSQGLPVNAKWELIGVLETPVTMDGDRWICIKSFNSQVHLIYGNNSGLYYAYSADNGSSWKKEPLDTRDKVNHVGTFSITPFDASLAVDSCGRPHVLYTVNWFHSGPSAAIHLVKEKNGKWKRDTIESRDASKMMIGMYADIEVDKKGNLHAVYMYDDKSFAYCFFNGKKWNITRNDPGPRPISVKLAVDDQCAPHIVVGKFYFSLCEVERVTR